MSANDDDAWLLTLGSIAIFRSGVSPIVAMLRELDEDPDIASAIAIGRLDRRGKLRGFVNYRVHGNHIVAILGNFRIEFDMAHPEAFSAYLLRRHIDLNRKLKRFYPQFVSVPVAKGLEQLAERGLIRAIDSRRWNHCEASRTTAKSAMQMTRPVGQAAQAVIHGWPGQCGLMEPKPCVYPG